MEGFVSADSADGTQDSNGLYRITSVSRSMIYELGQCIAKAYHRPFSIYFTQRTRTTVIEGRTVNQKDTYSIHYKLTTNTQDKAFYEDGYVWAPINEVLQEEYKGLVYNLEVEDDNSYVVQNVIVHNCQDFSVAGKQKGSVWTCKDCDEEYNPLTVHWSKRDCCPNCGSKNIEKTRSSLLVEYLRVVRANKPNFGIYENVKNIVGKQFKDTTFKLFTDELEEYGSLLVEYLRVVRANKPNFGIYENVKNIVGKQFKDTTFKLFTDELEEYGYNVYWKVLNAKNYGIPQNRERVYLLFIKKDLDNGEFKFPEPFDNGLRLKDLLEDEVDEKFYISDEKVERFITNLNHKDSLLYDPCQVKREGKSREYSDYAPTLTSRDYKDPRLVNENVVRQVGNISDGNGAWGNPQVGRVYDISGCSPTLNTCSGGGHEPKVITGIDKSYNNPKFIDTANCITSREDRGISNRKSEGAAVLKIGNINPSGNGMNGSVYSEDGLLPTITTNKGEGSKVAILPVTNNIRIRKLTPRETFRLMGFSDRDFDVAQNAGISNSQLYKQAGNSIVVDVLYYIYRELYIAMPYLFNDLKLSSFFSGIGAFECGLDRLYKDINSGNFTKPQEE